MFKVVKGLAPTIINDSFPLDNKWTIITWDNWDTNSFLRYVEMRQYVMVSKAYDI